MVSGFHFWSLSSDTELVHSIWDKDVCACVYMYVCKLETDSWHLRNQPFPWQEEMNNSTAENYALSSVASSYRQTTTVPQDLASQVAKMCPQNCKQNKG